MQTRLDIFLNLNNDPGDSAALLPQYSETFWNFFHKTLVFKFSNYVNYKPIFESTSPSILAFKAFNSNLNPSEVIELFLHLENSNI